MTKNCTCSQPGKIDRWISMGRTHCHRCSKPIVTVEEVVVTQSSAPVTPKSDPIPITPPPPRQQPGVGLFDIDSGN